MNPLPTVLLIDDEERIVRSLKFLLRSRFEVIATTDPHEALAVLRERRVHVVVSDQRMPVMIGAELLRQAKTISPNTLRILLTGYSELDAVVASINDGEIFRFVSKPWDPAALTATVQKAAEIAQGLFAAADDIARARAEGARRREAGILVMDAGPGTADLVRQVTEHELGAGVPVYCAQTAEEGLARLAESAVGVLVCDVRLAGREVTGAIKLFKQQFPQLVTLVVTEHRDTGVLIDLINEGQVFRFLPKPASRTLLARNLAAAYGYHQTLSAAPSLIASHQVEPVRKEAELSLVTRLKGMFDRLRGRTGEVRLREAYETP